MRKQIPCVLTTALLAAAMVGSYANNASADKPAPSTSSGPSTQPTTRPAASSKAAAAYAKRIDGVLPREWGVGANRNVVVVARLDPVEWFGTINLPDHKDKADLKAKGFTHSSKYTITLEFFSPMTPEDVQRLKDDNQRMIDAYYAEHPVDPNKKPSGLPPEVKHRLHHVPNILAKDCSVIVTPFIEGPGLAFYDDTVGSECKAVEQSVRDLLQPPTTQPATMPSAEPTR